MFIIVFLVAEFTYDFKIQIKLPEASLVHIEAA